MLTIPEERMHTFKAVAYMIERKLLDLQMQIIAHRHSLRFVCIEYKASLTEKEFAEIEEEINKMYDLLEIFCNEYSVPKMEVYLKAELMVKSNFLWEDLCGAISLRGYGQMDDTIIKDYTQKINTMVDSANNLIEKFKKITYENHKD